MLDETNNPNDSDLNEDLSEDSSGTTPPEESNNRTFWIIGGILGGLILLTLACVAVYILYLGPRLAAQRNSSQATIQAENAQVIQQMTSTAQAALWTPTSLPTSTSTKTAIPTLPKPTDTPVVAATVSTPTPTVVSESATLVFLQTQLAIQLTSTAAAVAAAQTTTPGGTLATTGFFDQVGLPTLIVLSLALLAVIFVARRLRSAPTK
jgi:cytoskeletal protein RodZ